MKGGGMMELKDTVEGMTSPDYKERFKAEYQQTKIRYKKLKRFCNKIELAAIKAEEEEPEHDCPLDLLREQQNIMRHYLRLLKLRAVIEKIEL